jgi:hypothetical protein
MNPKLKTTLIAAAVSSVLSTSALAATPSVQNHTALANVDHNANVARQQADTPISKSGSRANAQTRLKSQASKQPLNGNGIKRVNTADHFDKHLKTHTFSWATGQQKSTSLPFAVLNRSSAIESAARSYVSQVGAKHGVSASAFANAQLKYADSTRQGSIISKYQQKTNGIEVYSRQLNLLMDKNMQLVSTSGYFSNALAPKQSLARQFKLTTAQAIEKAFANLGGADIKLSKQADKANYQQFDAASDSYTFTAQPRGKKVYYPGVKTLTPAYYVEIMAAQKGKLELMAYSLIISAVDGQVLNRTNLTQSDAFTYKAFADNQAPYIPFDSPMGNDLTPHPTGVYNDRISETQVPMNDVTLEHSGISTNDPWLPAGATSTSGNNVDAYADLVAPDGFSDGDIRAQTTSANTFDYSYTHGDKVNSEENLNAAIVNLFYVNNHLHDVYYDHGFNEASGVAQMDNFGRGGIEGDPIHAEAQDHTGLNNATMSTPADGASPRMHMFLWQTDTIRDGTVDNPIVEHEWGHYISSRLTGGGMYANSQGASMGEGWGDFFALMTMVRETDQLLAGNDQWQGLYNDGGYAVNNGFTEFAYFFGLRRAPYTTDMDHNAFTFKHIQLNVANPDTHPISNLYDDDFSMSGAFNAEVHSAGEIWAMALWESYSGLLNRDALSFSEAQSRMRDYMVASMKITPFAPTFTEARDALLAVAIANDVEDYNVIRTAFAKRGMGAGAVSPERFDTGWNRQGTGDGHRGVVESFDAFASAVSLDAVALDNQSNTAQGSFCDVDGVLDAGETSVLTVNLSNSGTNALSGIKAQLTSDADITFANGGLIEFDQMPVWRDTTSGTIAATLNSADTNQRVGITISFSSDDPAVKLPDDIRTVVNVNTDMNQIRAVEDFESLDSVWTDWSRTQLLDNGGEDPEHILSQWDIFDDVDFGYVAFGPDLSQQNDTTLASRQFTVADSGDFVIAFDHYYEFEYGDPSNPRDETAWDGGVMEISVDSGDWVDVTAAGGTFLSGYNGVIAQSNPYLSNRPGFISLIPDTWIAPESLTFSDGTLNGKAIRFRFRISTDQTVAAWGWNIDNLTLTNATTDTPFSSLGDNAGICVNREPHLVEVDGPATVKGAQPTTLTATGLDHDDSTLTYQWAQSAGSQVIDVSSTSSTLTFNSPRLNVDEVYSFTVSVFDGELSSAAQSISVTVQGNNAPVITTAQAATTINEQQTVTLTVEGSDAEDDTLTYQWTINGEPQDNTGNTFDYSAPNVSVDTDVVLSVIASDGIASSESVEMTVSIIANKTPLISAEQSAVSVKVTQAVTLNVTATDPENDALTYHWMMDGTAIENNSASYSFSAPTVSQDTDVTFSVTASDGDNTSEAVQMVVTIIANLAPTISAEQATVVIREGELVTLSVSGSDPESDSLSYQWTMDGEPVSNNGSSYEFTGPSVNSDTTVTFAVTASDGENTSEATQINVTVEDRSSGGGMGIVALLLAPLAFIRRRKVK